MPTSKGKTELSNRKTSTSSSKTNKKFQVVILLGQDQQASAAFIKDHIDKLNAKDAVYFVSNNTPINSQDLSDLQDRTDENTIFIINAHGINENIENKDATKETIHFIDEVRTSEFFNNLRKKIGLKRNKKICALFFSCNAGSVIKNDIIDPNISLLARGSSKHPVLSSHDLDAISQTLKSKIVDKLDNQQIFEKLTSQDPETFYYHRGNGLEDFKISRIGKFSLKEIEIFLKDSDFAKEDVDKISSTLIASSKEEFSMNGFRKIIENLNINTQHYKDFITQLESVLREKLSTDGIRIFMKDRGEENLSEEQISQIKFKALFMALDSRRDLDMVKAIISAADGKNIIEKTDNYKFTPIFIALNNQYVEGVKILLDAGANTEVRDIDGITPLIAAVTSGNVDIIQLFINQNVDLNYPGASGYTALMHAANSGKKEIVKMLTDAGANALISNHGNTALIIAQKQYKKIIEEENANLDHDEKHMSSKSDVLNKNNLEEIIKILREAENNFGLKKRKSLIKAKGHKIQKTENSQSNFQNQH